MCTQTYLHCTTCNQTHPDTLTTCPTHCTARNPSFRRSVDIHVVQCRVCILRATPPPTPSPTTPTSSPTPTPTTTKPGKRFEAPPLTVLRRVEKRVWTPLVRRKVAQARPAPAAEPERLPAAGTAGKGKGRGTVRKTIGSGSGIGRAKVAVPVSRPRAGVPVGGAAAQAAAQAAVRGWRCLASGYRVCKY